MLNFRWKRVGSRSLWSADLMIFSHVILDFFYSWIWSLRSLNLLKWDFFGRFLFFWFSVNKYICRWFVWSIQWLLLRCYLCNISFVSFKSFNKLKITWFDVIGCWLLDLSASFKSSSLWSTGFVDLFCSCLRCFLRRRILAEKW